MPYLILLCAVSLAAANGYTLKKFGHRGVRNTGDALAFNGAISAVWLVILLAWELIERGGRVSLSPTAALYGVLYGLDLSLFLFFKTEAMTSGPVSLTTLIGACGFLIVTLFSAIYYREAVSPLQALGILLMLVALFFCMRPKQGAMKLTPRWKTCVTLYFFTGGGLSCINKLFRNSPGREEIGGMMAVAAVVSALALTASALILNGAQKNPPPRISRVGGTYVLLCGAISCVYSRLNVYLAGALPAVILFPLSNGCLILLTTLMSTLALKERLSAVQIAAMAGGFVAMVLIGCF